MLPEALTGDRLERAVFAALDRIAPQGALGVAVSGGSDSTALLVLADAWARDRGRVLHTVTVDHGLRAGSAAESTGVTKLAARFGLPHDILSWERQGPPRNLQAEARAARQRLIGAWAAERGLAGVLLGHTRDDQAETVLLRLARGSGLDGLAAMSERTEIAGTLWLRPLLGVGRRDLRVLLAARGIGWAEDPSNEDTRFDRVRARRALAVLAPVGIDAARLAETAARLAEDCAVLAHAVAELAAETCTWGPFGEVWLDPSGLAAAPRTLTARLFGDVLRRVSGADYAPRRAALDALLDRALEPEFPGATLAGCVLRRAGAHLLIHREAAAQEARAPARDGTTWDGRWRLSLDCDGPPALEIGALEAKGLARLRTVGWEGPEAWAHAPAALRRTVPALWLSDAPVAVPHAGYCADPSLAATLADLAAANRPAPLRNLTKLDP